jgi:hypothetical protein
LLDGYFRQAEITPTSELAEPDLAHEVYKRLHSHNVSVSRWLPDPGGLNQGVAGFFLISNPAMPNSSAQQDHRLIVRRGQRVPFAASRCTAFAW